MRFNDYANEIHTLVSRHTPLGENRKLRRDPAKSGGKVYTQLRDPLLLNMGGTLSFSIQIEISSGNVEYTNYVYEYKKNGYFFRYDKTDRGYIKYSHEVCHLHANAEEPRYPTHSITLEEILGFISGSFP